MKSQMGLVMNIVLGIIGAAVASTRNHWSAKRALSRFWWTSDLVQANGLACSL
jgi:uncharacterized membrane protein YeaQ/YmgE (transglycosylase-associated protein family)